MVSSIFDQFLEQAKSATGEEVSPALKQELEQAAPPAAPQPTQPDPFANFLKGPGIQQPIAGPEPLPGFQPPKEPGVFERFAGALGFEKIPSEPLTPEEEAEALTNVPIYLDPELFIMGAFTGPLLAVRSGVTGAKALLGAAAKGGISFQTLGIPQVAKQLLKAGIGATRFTGQVLRNPKGFIETSRQVGRGLASGFSKEAAASFGAVGAAAEGIRQAGEEEFDLESLVNVTILTSLGGQLAKGGVGIAQKKIQRALESGTVPKPLERLFAGRGGESFQRLKRFMKADIAIGTQEAIEVAERASINLSAAEQLRLGQLLRGGISASKGKLVGIANDIRPVLQDIEKQLVEVGSLSPQSVRRIEGLFQTYFPRVMEAGLIKSPTSGLALGGSKPVRAGRSQFLRQRGDVVEFELAREGQAGAKVRTKEGLITVAPIKDVGKGKERAEVLNPLLEKGFVVTDRAGRKITMFQDTPEIMRLTPVAKGGLGEIRQPSIPLALSISKNRREIAVKRLFSEINKNPRWTIQGGVAEAEAKVARRQQRLPKVGYSQVPIDKKKYGDLAGKFVRDDIRSEIDETFEILSTTNEVIKKTLGWWKQGKTVLNPSTHMRNIMANTILADLGGVSLARPSGWTSYTMAMQELAGSARMPKGFTFGMKSAAGLAKSLSRRTNVGQFLKEAESREAGGLLSSTLSSQELQAFTGGFAESKSSNMLIRIIDGASNLMTKIGEAAHISPGGIYRVEEEFNKLALFIHGRRNLGLSIENAANFSRKYGIDYSEVSSVVNTLRGGRGAGGLFGSPFVTFTAKATPLYLEALVKNPIRAAKWPIAALGLSEASRRFLDETPEKATSERELAKLNPVRWIKMPYKDDNNNSVFLDMGYIFPFGDLVELLEVAQGNETEGFSGFLPLVNSPIMSVIEAGLNVSTFTERPVDPLQPPGTFPRSLRSAGRRGKFLAQEALPSLTPGVGFGAEKLRKAFTGEVEQFSGRPISKAGAVSSTLLGLRTKTVDPQDELSFRSFESLGQIRRLQSEISRISRNRNIIQEDKNVQIELLTKEIGELSRQLGKDVQLFQEAR